MIDELLSKIIANRWAKFVEDCPDDFPNNPTSDECWTWVGGMTAGPRPHPRAKLVCEQVSPRRLLYALHNRSFATPGRITPGCGNVFCINPMHMTGNLVAIPSPYTPVPPPASSVPYETKSTPEELAAQIEAMRQAAHGKLREMQITQRTPDVRTLLLRCGFSEYVLDNFLEDYLDANP